MAEPRPSTDDDSAPLLERGDGDGETQAPLLLDRIKAHAASIFQPLAEPDSLRPLERFLVFVALLFLLLFAIFVGLFAGAQHRVNHLPFCDPGDGGITTSTNPHPGPTVTATTTKIPSVPGPTGSPSPSPGNDGRRDNICLTRECVLAASTIITSLDESVDPCTDFYQFSVGGWLKQHPIPPGKGAFGAFNLLQQQNLDLIKSIIDDASPARLASSASEHLSDADVGNLATLREFYDSCMDEKALDQMGTQPLLEIVQEIRKLYSSGQEDDFRWDEWQRNSAVGEQPVFAIQDGNRSPQPPPPGAPRPAPTDERPPKPNPHPHPPTELPKPGPLPPRGKGLTNALLWAQSRGIDALFRFEISGDYKNDPTRNVIFLTQGGLGLPDRSYYKDDETVKFYRTIVHGVLKELYEVQDGNGEQADGTLADKVVDFEMEIAKFSLDPVDLDDPYATYNPVSSFRLSILFPHVIWPDFFGGLNVRGPDYPAYPSRIILTSPDYVKKLSHLVSRTPSPVLEAYLVWHAGNALGPNLGPKQPVRQALENLKSRLRGSEGKPERETTCLEEVEDKFGFLAGRYFVERAFTGDSKDKAEGIIRDVIAAFKRRLSELDWLDEDTRSAAEKKADFIRVKIGYPLSPNTEDPKSLARYYALSEVKDGDHFGNVLRNRVADQVRRWAMAGRPKDEKAWVDFVPSTVNAYYTAEDNEIVFPAGILQPTWFHKDWPEYLSFGAFGSVAGHELTHAFDKTGRLFDGEGYLANWWTNKTDRAFTKRQRCLEEQYGNLTLPGTDKHLNSRLTIGEDLADHGGLAQSLRAWRDRFAVEGTNGDDQHHNLLLPGLNYTREQLFFVAYGLGWARNVSPQEALLRLRTDPHSPNRFRTIGTLSNNLDFAKAFNCTLGSPMAPKDRCAIW